MIKMAQPLGLYSGILESNGDCKMPNQNDTPESPDSQGPAEIEKLEDQKMLDRVANKTAEQAGETKQRYDHDHSIFTI